MKPTLSIIIPCYNCEKTLEESVDSCFDQNLNDFEIVLVDDGSTDSTPALIQNLATQHSQIRYFLKEKNEGGGATRNRAVYESRSDIIFCLDSDDILPKNTLDRMLGFLDTKNCDGVLFEATHFFEDSDITKVEIVKNISDGQRVHFEDLFKSNTGFLTKVNFLYTKKLFEQAGGYPEDHGFDTQTFGYKCLLNGGIVFVCPDTHYLHRRNSKQNSYFMREYFEGKLSFNTYLMLEDMIHIFSDNTIDEILKFNIVENNKLGQINLPIFLEELFKKNKTENFFIQNYQNYIRPDSFAFYMEDFEEKRSDSIKEYIASVYDMKMARYDDSLSKLSRLVQNHSSFHLLYINMIRCSLYKTQTEKRIPNEISFKAFSYQNNTPSWITLVYRVINKINTLWNK